MRRQRCLFLLLSCLVVPSIGACSASTGEQGPDDSAAGERAAPRAPAEPPTSGAEGTDYSVLHQSWAPCPDSWCGISNECQTWTCIQPFPSVAGETYQCIRSYTAAGTSCSDATTCVTSGTCTGSGACAPRPGGREVCSQTATGQADGYECGACSNGTCTARVGNTLVDPAPSWACTLGTE